jgi:hypothetical protein
MDMSIPNAVINVIIDVPP